jgi:hypothetical protein
MLRILVCSQISRLSATRFPMIDSTIEWSTLPPTVVPRLFRHHLPPGTDAFIPSHTMPNKNERSNRRL